MSVSTADFRSIDRFSLLLDVAKNLAKTGDFLGAIMMIEEAVVVIARLPVITKDNTDEAI